MNRWILSPGGCVGFFDVQPVQGSETVGPVELRKCEHEKNGRNLFPFPRPTLSLWRLPFYLRAWNRLFDVLRSEWSQIIELKLIGTHPKIIGVFHIFLTRHCDCCWKRSPKIFSEFLMNVRLLHILERSIVPIRVANSFGWDEKAT